MLHMLQVAKTRSCKPYSKSGMARINVTFRKFKQLWEKRAPNCRCNRQAAMRTYINKQGKVKYCYKCDNSQGPDCKFWQHLFVP